ncbi:MAG: hypothetical protein RIC93_11220 [Alphaproteobacteria bacterium]
MTGQLPEGFGELGPLLDRWALPTEKARNERRHKSTMEEIGEFYETVLPKMEKIAAHLDQFDIGTLDEKEQNLLNLSCMLIEIAPCIELYGQVRVPNSFEIERYNIHGTGF